MSEQVKPIEGEAVVQQPFTAETIANAVAAGLQVHQAQVASAPRDMTEDEKKAYLQIFDPNADGFVDSFAAAITDPEATAETRAKAIEHLRDGLVNQSVRGAELLVAREVQKLRQEFTPVLQQSEKNKAEELWGLFAGKYPDLKEHRELVDAVSIQLQAQGFNPKDLDEAFTRAADTTRALVSKVTGKPVVTSSTQTAPQTMPRMSSTSTTPASGGPPNNADTPQSGVASFFKKRAR